MSDVWGTALRAGAARRDPQLGPLDLVVQAPLAIGDDVEHLLGFSRNMAALYIGGMGAKGKNFYNSLCRRYGWVEEAEEIQDLYLAGRKEEAAGRVPDELLRTMSLVGDEAFVSARLAALRAAGVTTHNVLPLAPTHEGRVDIIGQLRELLDRA